MVVEKKQKELDLVEKELNNIVVTLHLVMCIIEKLCRNHSSGFSGNPQQSVLAVEKKIIV